MGGLGKTTLAQLAYNDPRVERHFELRMWVCVSDDFNLKRVTKAIIEAATGSTCEELDMDLLQRRLQEKLGCKKFLLVLDDMWNEDPLEWERLKGYLRGAQGSKIIVTTRSEKVALIMGTLPLQQLARLSEDDCWSLFKKRAFAPEDEDRHPNLITLGKEIVKKCGGLPLAAKTLGSLMRFKREETEWIFLKQSEADKAVSIPKRSRHLSLMHDDVWDQICPDAINKAKKLRNLLLVGSTSCVQLPRNIYSHLMCLRVLDLERAFCSEETLVSIGKLKHLRYLAVSLYGIRKIPESFCTLVNLQTLKLSLCHSLHELPKHMRKMISLRHIEISSPFYGSWGLCSLHETPVQLGKLKCLQTLPIFAVGTSVGCRITELKDLNLQGQLFIKNLENVKDGNDAKEANLKQKQNLHVLAFSWSHCDNNAVVGENVEQVLEGLEPHPNLKKLRVDEYAEDVNLCPHLANYLFSRSSQFVEWMVLNVSILHSMERMSQVDSHL
ncbi:hypothetical protein AAC387_Pa02g4703 [Persea americana]